MGIKQISKQLQIGVGTVYSVLWKRNCDKTLKNTWLNINNVESHKIVVDFVIIKLLSIKLTRHMKMKKIILTLFMTLSIPVFAASFDCAKASTPHEKLICANPALSDADTQLGDVYKATNKSFIFCRIVCNFIIIIICC